MTFDPPPAAVWFIGKSLFRESPVSREQIRLVIHPRIH
jgi:hypothetical protein